MKHSIFSGLALGLGSLLAWPAPVLASDYNLTTSYENYWFRPGPPSGGCTDYFGTKASTVVYGGHVLGNTNSVPVPSDGQNFRLEYSALGQPVRNMMSDFVLGGFVVAPPGTDTNKPPANFIPVLVGENGEAYWQEPNGGAFWVPSTKAVIASQPNSVTIDWITTDNKTNRQVINVDGVPTTRPARLFWTEEPYYAPGVSLSGLFPAIHYNTQMWPYTERYETNGTTGDVTTNVSGVWLDDQKQLHAKDVSGTFILEYYQEGTYKTQVQPLGIEVVQVMPPDVQVVTCDVGTRLMPTELYWAEMDQVNGVIPNVTRGQNETVYVHAQNGPKYNWAFPIKRTYNEPWSLEIYWQHRGVMGVQWPYEADWYSCNWPAYPQLYTIGDSSSDQAPALIPAGLNAEVQADMDPALHAKLSTSGRSLITTSQGTCLVKYTTVDNVWFETVQTVSHANNYYFDLEPKEWPIGEELTPGDDQGYAMGFDGKADYASAGESWLNQQTNWTISLWFKIGDFRSCTLYSEGNPSGIFYLSLNTNKQIQIGTWNEVARKSTGFSSTPAPLKTNHWHYLTVAYSGGSDTNGTVRVYLDDYQWQTNGLPRVNSSGPEYAIIGAYSSSPLPSSGFVYGKLDQLRIWNIGLTADQVRRSEHETAAETVGNLVADFEFNEGQGAVAYNSAGDKNVTAGAGAFWCFGQVIPGTEWLGYPGFIHLPWGNSYNVNRYNYPSESNPDADSYVFGVNTGQLEVWWGHRSRQTDMPPVYYPSQVVRYTNVWPTKPPEIVIASGEGHNGDALAPADDALYFNGTSSYVQVPRNSVLEFKRDFTVEAWVNLSDTNTTQDIVSWSYPWTGCTGFRLAVSGGLVWGAYYYSPNYYYPLSGGVVPTNVWTHICLKAGDGEVGIYLNGEKVGARGAGADMAPYSGDLYIGRLSAGSQNFAHGSLGEVRIWNVNRTVQQLQDYRLVPLTGHEAGLVAYYPFVRGDDSTVLTDLGPNKMHGTVVGATWTTEGRPVHSTQTIVMGAPSIYYQNDSTKAGYNPNEEHGLVMSSTVYALRDDLNKPNTSEPFVLVDCLDQYSGRPKMKVFSVIETNELYAFHRSMEAGLPIVPLMPLGRMPLCKRTDSDQSTQPPAWEDRKEEWWAISAGTNGGTADAIMRFFYQVQPGFWFPDAAEQPAVGTEVPWLPKPFAEPGTSGTPVPVVYTISWPDAPELRLGQTVTKAYKGMPEIWGQLSVEAAYEQAGKGNSVELYDPVQSHGSALAKEVVDAMISSELARKDTIGSLVRFPNLSPSLYQRMYWDPNRGTNGELVIQGQYLETLTGAGYLLVNMLEDFERGQLYAAAEEIATDKKDKWKTAVAGLPEEITRIEPNDAYVHAAMGARLTSASGYVTLAFNNSTNAHQVPQELPVSLAVIHVDTNLYSGELEVILPGDVLAEQLSMRYSADFAGHVGDCEFRWKWIEPLGGLVPNYDFDGWNPYGPDKATGTNEVTIAGASQFTMSDNWFAVQYRPVDTSGPSGTNWSEWTYALAPGWVKRAMNGINPFMQMLPDMTENKVDPKVTMVSQAGGPYQGAIALNMDAVSEAGLIPAYETIFNRAKDFSLRVGSSSDSMNETLLYAASRLRDLYMLLGNEAYADAQDPTIAYPQELSVDTHGAAATSIFPFMNQVPNLLEEELALLRGRDDTLDPSVETSPVFNRLIWNFTSGISGGEPAYAYNYNIRGDPSNVVGTITVDDAKRLYPQGHGDAWGHYLSAINHYYDLLSYDVFRWHTEPSATLLGNASVTVDYFDEQKFAETAAARARTGTEIVKQTFRERYSEDPTAFWKQYDDSDADRAWGIGQWASRAGQAAYFDWVVANSLMYDELKLMSQVAGSNVPPVGIQKIDRKSTPELAEIVRNLQSMQQEVDSANGGCNPLGLAAGVVPFDIDPAAIDAGQTHFEQIYDRALQALYNACVTFDHARGATLRLREQFDSVYDLQEALESNETDYHNRLVQIYGYPYSDDIGPNGTYPEGYDGPDLLNWQIIELKNLLANVPSTEPLEVTVYNVKFEPGSEFESKHYYDYEDLSENSSTTNELVGTIKAYMTGDGIRVKPSGWTGQRRAEGELQAALAEFVQHWYSLDAKFKTYDQSLAELEAEVEHRLADYDRYPEEWAEHDANAEERKSTARAIAGMKIVKAELELAATSIKECAEVTDKAIPHVVSGISGIFPVLTTETDIGSIADIIVTTVFWASMAIGTQMEAAAEGTQMSQEIWNIDLEKLLKENEYYGLLKWNTSDTLVKLKGQYAQQAELYAEVEAFGQSQQRIKKLTAEGERLVFERAQVRSRAAQRIQTARYGDIGFRIFRDDALRRYQQAFDLAARYTYLAAKAYDYETGLLYSDTTHTAGSKYLENIVKARAPGRFYVWLGTPMTGGTEGEPGLADVLARMKADWDVAKGRFGFNNPDTETSRFSLRTELYRISPDAAGNGTWAAVLEDCKVANLHEVPEFIRYCRPYIDRTSIEPGIVIPFSTVVAPGQNYFGRPLAAGDNAYNASRAATKVRSAGVWFTGYDSVFNTNSTGAGLANGPQVYLVPVGEDVMRSPTRNAIEFRHWKVLDQAIPLPYNIGEAQVDNPDWQPLVDSLSEPFAQIRRFASFRAYHDSGEFDPSETCTNGRLIGRSVWNTKWLLIIPGRVLLSDPTEGIERFIHGGIGDNKLRSGEGITDIKIFFQTYSIPGD